MWRIASLRFRPQPGFAALLSRAIYLKSNVPAAHCSVVHLPKSVSGVGCTWFSEGKRQDRSNVVSRSCALYRANVR